jgi:hypothetical protein
MTQQQLACRFELFPAVQTGEPPSHRKRVGKRSRVFSRYTVIKRLTQYWQYWCQVNYLFSNRQPTFFICNSSFIFFKISILQQEVATLFSGLRPEKEPPSAGISNEEQGTPNIEGRRRFAPYISSKKDCAVGAPSFDIPCSIFVIRYSKLCTTCW